MAKLIKGVNDLATVRPDLVAQWHPTKNGNLKPEDVAAGSNKKVWWLLPYDVPDDYPVKHLRGKHFDFEWQALIGNRHKGEGCPYLVSKKIKVGFNDLMTTHPDLAKEWHPTKNGNLKPTDVTFGSHKKVWWLLPYDVPDDHPIEILRGKHFDFEWEATIDSRSLNGSCPFFNGQKIWNGFNDLASTFPDIAKQWHPTKNGNLTPLNVTPFSPKKVWWLLPYDVPDDYPVEHLRGTHFDFEWQGLISNRTSGADKCPYLTGQAVWAGFNDLSTTHPKLAKEWNYAKNANLKNGRGRDISTPDKIMAGSSSTKVWWKCPVCGCEWEAKLNNRTSSNSGCPNCAESKGEAIVRGILESNNLMFKSQNTFRDRFIKKKGKLLRDDFALLSRDGEVVATVEYNGIQHYKVVDFAGNGKAWAEKEFQELKARDRLKADYLKIHNIPQLIIPYWEFDNIEEIVKQFIIDLNNRNIFIGTKRATA